jgi:hypothetical protein
VSRGVAKAKKDATQVVLSINSKGEIVAVK